MAYQKIITTSISASASSTATSSIKLNELTVVGITAGSSFSGSIMSFQVSLDDTTFYPLANKDGEVTYTTIGGSVAWAIATDPADFYAWNFLKISEGTNASRVSQKVANCPINISAKLI